MRFNGKIMFMEGTIQEIKNKVDIATFIGSFISIKKTGRNYKALCPFHQEKTPSFVISPDRQIWHCFGACQDGGDVIKFLMKWENISFIEALRELADKFGIRLKDVRFEDQEWKRKEKIMRINKLTTDYYEYILHETKYGNTAQEYLRKRGLNEKVIKTFHLGYAPSSWHSLLKFLQKKFTLEDILTSGLVITSEKGTVYDRFRGRLIFPIKDARSNVIGFSGRLLEDKAKEAKYINTPETLLYHKRESLYAIDIAKDQIKKQNNVYIVEGEFDVLSPFQIGIGNIVAIKGSALTREQLMLLKRYTNKITLALDSDVAGEEAMKKGIEEAEDLEFDVDVVVFDYAKDPDEAARRDPTLFKKGIKDPIPFYDFIIQILVKKFPQDNPYNKKQIANTAVFFITKIKNPIVKSHYVKKLATLLDVSESSIESLLRLTNRKKERKFILSSQPKYSHMRREDIIQKYLLSLLFQSANPYKFVDEYFKLFSIEDFSLPSLKKLYHYFTDFRKSNKEFHLDYFIKTIPQELHPVFDEIYLMASLDNEFKNEKIEKLIYEIKRYSLKYRIAQILSSESSEKKETENSLRLMGNELTRVEKMIVAL